MGPHYKEWDWGPPTNKTFPNHYRDNGGVYWYDKYWESPSDDNNGLYFGIWNLESLVNLDESEKDDDQPYLYLWDDARVGGVTEKAFKQEFAKAENELVRKLPGVIINKSEKDGTYLARLNIGETISIERLHEDQVASMSNEFVEKAQKFTEILAPVAYRILGVI